MISKNNTKLEDESLKGILKDKKICDLKPNSLLININYGNNNIFRFEVSDNNTGDLGFDINCYDLYVRDEIQFEIEKWIEDKLLSKIMQIWSNAAVVLFFLFFLALFVTGSLTFSKEYSTYKDILIMQSNELLIQGIDSSNQYKALEVLLKFHNNYQSKDFEAIVKSIKPIYYNRFYKIWIKFILFTLPEILLVGPFSNRIIECLY
ncbi:MAG: hypothetical protein ABIJ97_11100 [Bacteroidota bacterium]